MAAEEVFMVRDCDCDAKQSTARHWTTMEPSADGKSATLTYFFDPQLGCEKCHKPWRRVVREAQTDTRARSEKERT